jgi:hypothetical protein
MQLLEVLAAFTGTSYRPEVEATPEADSGETAPGQPAP